MRWNLVLSVDMLEFSIKFGTEFSIEFDIEFDKLEIGIECGKLSNFWLISEATTYCYDG